MRSMGGLVVEDHGELRRVIEMFFIFTEVTFTKVYTCVKMHQNRLGRIALFCFVNYTSIKLS